MEICLLPDRPSVMIHKGWRQSQDSTASPRNPKIKYMSMKDEPQDTKKMRSIDIGRTFEFVNLTKPGQNKDTAVRKLVRTHVRNDFVRQERLGKKDRTRKSISFHLPGRRPTQKVAKNITESESERVVNIPPPLGQPTALIVSEYPIPLQPHAHDLLNHYITYASTRMYPIESSLNSNPLKSPEWFQYAVTDAAILQAALYASAVYIALTEGKRETPETLYYQSLTVSIVQKRLKYSTSEVEDSTIGAISCLALGEAVLGNPAQWKIHMNGLKQMINARCNNSPLSPLIQGKIHRSDLTGAIDYGATPFLPLKRSPTPPTWSILPAPTITNTTNTLTSLLSPTIHLSLITTLIHLSLFSTSIIYAHHNPSEKLSASAFSEDKSSIEYALLSFSSTLPHGEKETGIESALRMAGLLFIKAILQEFPHSSNGNSILLSKMMKGLSCVVEEKRSGNEALLVWIGMVGALCAKGEVRDWLMEYVGRMVKSMMVKDLGDNKLVLNRLLSLEAVFGKGVSELWREVLGL